MPACATATIFAPVSEAVVTANLIPETASSDSGAALMPTAN